MAASTGHQKMMPQLPGRFSVFTGDTYPDTSTGLAACDAQGHADEVHGLGYVVGYTCALGDPDAGVYNLWLIEQEPSGPPVNVKPL